MAGKTKMRDIVIVVPGLMGSELQKDGQDVWAATPNAVENLLFSRFRSVQELEMAGDDPDLDDLEDGIKATKILDDIVVIPGLIKIDGYSGLRQLILDRFDVILGSVNIPAPANYFEFAYDWRRDIRANARKLKELIDDRLPLWRKHSGADDARVILIGHSMGGLVSRHYLEMMAGWRHCRALISLGTPHRGAVNAAETLGNGINILGLDISKALRSMTGMYQILPIYPVIDNGSEVVRLMDTDAIPHLSRRQAADGTKFLLDIARAVEDHQGLPAYRNDGYQLIPVVGTRQPTNQSLQIVNGRLKALRTSAIMDPSLTHGDGTVPFVSAIPIEMSETYRDSFFTLKHGAIQNSPIVLELIRGLLTRMQVSLAQFKGLPAAETMEPDTALSLDLPDFVAQGSPLEFEVVAQNAPDSLQLSAVIESTNAPQPPQQISLARDGDTWQAVVEDLPPGYYRLTLSASSPGYTPITDVFVVA